MIVDEEIFQFLQKRFAQVLDVLNVRKAMIFFFDSHNAIISFKFLFPTLFTLDDSNDPALHGDLVFFLVDARVEAQLDSGRAPRDQTHRGGSHPFGIPVLHPF